MALAVGLLAPHRRRRVRSRPWQRVLAALEWIDHFGDRDDDGYVEYATRSSEGLGNQCWKDSWDGIQFEDGRIPFLPIATAEIQGYVYDAKLRVAELARRSMDDTTLADRLEREAGELFTRFNSDFWSDERGGYYFVGLDGDKHAIDSLTSNLGHLLLVGDRPRGARARIASHLLSEDLFSGWGVRTLSRRDLGYNPIGYHTQDDLAARQRDHRPRAGAPGVPREANRIALADQGRYALELPPPEAFAGFDRVLSGFPVPYPTACSPQAWATGAPFVFVKVMLGLEARDREIHLDPHVPDEIGRIQIRNMPAFGAHWDVEANGTRGFVRLAR